MLKRSFIIIVMLVVALGCANQQKEDAEESQAPEVVVEEISLAVTGLA